MKRSTLISLLAVLAVLGLADAAYLAETALTGGELTCNIEGLSKCNIVAQSAYSHVLGIPLGVYGAVFYAVFLVAALIAAKRGGKGMDRLLGILSVVGALASAWFLYIQLALIKAVCIYCLASAAISAFLFVAAMALIVRRETGPSASTSVS